MEEEKKKFLIARHYALVNLAKYVEGDVNGFIDFLKNVFLFEKNIELAKDPSHAQCSLFRQLITNDHQLRKVFFSEEWQQACDYFVLENNTSKLLDIFYQLEIGTSTCKEQSHEQLRLKLLQDAFFARSHPRSTVQYNDLLIKFEFCADVLRWGVKKIQWELKENQGELHVVGIPVISLGLPSPDGPEMYRESFAIMGLEKKAVATLAIRGMVTDNQPLQMLAEEIIEKMDFQPEQIGTLLENESINVRKAYERWSKLSSMEREFSSEGIRFQIETMLEAEKNNPSLYHVIKQRFEDAGLLLSDLSKPSGYDFSNEVAKGNVIRSKPAVKYYWPQNNSWDIIFAGKCNFSAGPIPIFLCKIDSLTKAGILEPRSEDLRLVRELLLYIQLGDKVPKPPILPVYNALRRWVEALAARKDYQSLEELCHHAKILRPHIQIPAMGEKPFTIANREHQLIARLAPEHKPGIIVGIKQAGIMVPDNRIPLCLPGIYWVARQHSHLQKLIELTSPLMMDADPGLHRAWQNLSVQEDVEDLFVLVRALLNDIASIKEEIWESIKKTIDDFNTYRQEKIIFLPHRNITVEQLKELEKDARFKLKIAHTGKREEGIVISQRPGTEQCVIVVASGIPPKLLQSIHKLYQWAEEKGFSTEQGSIESIKCNFLSYLRQEPQKSSVMQLLEFCKKQAETEEYVQEKAILQKWVKGRS